MAGPHRRSRSSSTDHAGHPVGGPQCIWLYNKIGGPVGYSPAASIGGGVVSVRVASLVASAVCIFSVLAGASKAAEVRPAVDGVNSVVEVTGGSLSGTSLYGSGGILSIPLTGPYGLEITGGGGSLDGRGIGLAGANLFWRDPALARFGLVSNYLYWDSPIGAVNGYRVGGQAEGYFGRFTLGGALPV